MQRLLFTHAAPRAPLRLPCRSAQRSAVVVRAAAADELQPWQVEKMQQALAAGRRQVKVEKLCKEVGLPRGTVLQWLKEAPQPDRTQASLYQARAAAEQAALERQALLQQGQEQAARSVAESSRQRAPAPTVRHGPGAFGGAPAWKQYAKDKKLGRQAEATLEMLYSRTQWPSDEAVSSLWDLHRLPREKVVAWFQEKRRQEQRRRGAGGSVAVGGRSAAGGRSVAAARGGGGSIDWDAEWERQ